MTGGRQDSVPSHLQLCQKYAIPRSSRATLNSQATGNRYRYSAPITNGAEALRLRAGQITMQHERVDDRHSRGAVQGTRIARLTLSVPGLIQPIKEQKGICE